MLPRPSGDFIVLAYKVRGFALIGISEDVGAQPRLRRTRDRQAERQRGSLGPYATLGQPVAHRHGHRREQVASLQVLVETQCERAVYRLLSRAFTAVQACSARGRIVASVKAWVRRAAFPSAALQAVDVPNPSRLGRIQIAGAAALLGVSAMALLTLPVAAPWGSWPWALAALLLVLFASRRVGARLDVGRQDAVALTVDGAAYLCGVMLLPPLVLPLLALTVVFGGVDWLKNLWNFCAQLMAMALAAFSYWQLATPALSASPIDFRSLLIASGAAIAVSWVTVDLLYGWVQAATTGSSLRVADLWDLRAVGVYGAGATIAILALVSPYLLVLGVPLFALLVHDVNLSRALLERRSDAKTGLLQLKTFMDAADRELTRSKRSGEPLALLMLDLDHFRAINQRFGHPTGDLLLAQLGPILTQYLRGGDLAGRFGGEEFIVALPAASRQDAALAAERIRQAVAGADWAATHGSLAVTVSIGVAPVDPTRGIAVALERADAALYEAKTRGRNRVCLSDPWTCELEPLPMAERDHVTGTPRPGVTED